jgi:hypothetical protein
MNNMLNQLVLIGRVTMITDKHLHLKVNLSDKDLVISTDQFIIDKSMVGETLAIKGFLVMTHHLEIHLERYSYLKGGEVDGESN